MQTADQLAATRKPYDLAYRRTNRLAVDWLKMHEPAVWTSICDYVEQQAAA